MSARDTEVRSAAAALFALAGAASGIAVVLEVAAVVAGVWLALVQAAQWSTTATLGLLALASYTLRGWAGDWKNQGDDLLRLLEISDGLGRPIPAAQRADALARVTWLTDWVPVQPPGGAPFASAAPGSPRRLVEVVRESAWWSSQVGETSAALQRVSIVFFAFMAVAALAAGAMRSSTTPGLLTAPTLAVAVLLFLFTSGPQRRLRELTRFREDSARFAAEATAALKHPEAISEPDALLLASEYHLARKGSPLLSGLVWRARRRKLNRLWDEHFREGAQPTGG